MGIKAHPKVLKQVNTEIVLDALRRMQRATRGDIAKRVGLSQPTVNAIIKDLCKEEVILSDGYAAHEGGRRALIFQVNPKHYRLVIIWMTFDTIKYQVLDSENAVLLFGNETLPGKNNNTYHTLVDLLDKLFAEVENIRAIGIAVPGAVSLSGTVFAIPQLPELEEKPLATLLQDRFGVPIYLQNDMNVAAFGYYQSLSSDLLSDLAFIHIGKGIGAGLVINGSIVCGFSSFAGEISYMFPDAKTTIQNGSGPFEIMYQNASTPKERVVTIARMTTNLICMINPPILVFTGSGVSKPMLTEIKTICEQYIPITAMPQFEFVSDLDKYFCCGLARLTYELIDKGIRIVDNRQTVQKDILYG